LAYKNQSEFKYQYKQVTRCSCKLWVHDVLEFLLGLDIVALEK